MQAYLLAVYGIGFSRPRALSKGAIAQYQTTPLLLEVYTTPPRESRDPNRPIANFRCINVAPDDEEARFSELFLLESLSHVAPDDEEARFSDDIYSDIVYGLVIRYEPKISCQFLK
ncbi:hypothetical protein WN51_14179 [Melipona quadrifasciata]|uniref:Uncharacterized protein n=1 Tax=Melipona quadrifasciata TaxID=166423 RepID=A0A0M9A1V3_9HYME|nr:hypothetical protein WN51_14179 [Melipona quadrifasciata]